MKRTVLIYLHGFNSSPDSIKAQQMRKFVWARYPGIELLMPQIALTPAAAWQQLDQLVSEYQGQQIGFVGSSLGGFFATLLANKYGGNAVLINPAVRPQLIADVIVGLHTHPNSQQVYQIDSGHIDELARLDWTTLDSPQNYWLLLQQGDETLDYRQANEAYQGARITLEPDGDHSFIGFSRYLNAIVEFLFEN